MLISKDNKCTGILAVKEVTAQAYFLPKWELPHIVTEKRVRRPIVCSNIAPQCWSEHVGGRLSQVEIQLLLVGHWIFSVANYFLMGSRTGFSIRTIRVYRDYLRSVRLIEVSGDTKWDIAIPGTCSAELQIRNSAHLLQTSWASRNVGLPPLLKWSKSLFWENEMYIISNACLLYMYVVHVLFS